jgi:hypothetical protein
MRKPKFPKKPKNSSSMAVWERYYERVKMVAAKRKAIDDAPKKKASLMTKVNALKARS